MDDKRLEELLSAVVEKKSSGGILSSELANGLFKFMMTASTAATMWIFGAVQESKLVQQQLQSDVTHIKEDVNDFSDFADKPRFSQDDFDQRTEPVFKSLEKILDRLEEDAKNIEDFEKRIVDIEYRLSRLEE